MPVKTLKPKPCRWCKESFIPTSSMQVCCKPFPCALEYGRNKQSIKAKRPKSSGNKPQSKSVRELNRETLSWQHKQTQKSFNKMRVLEELLWFKERNMEPECISCGRGIGNDHWCCGHFKTVGSNGLLRYDRKNTYLQHNVRCNQALSGDIYGTKTTRGYIQGIKDRFGDKEGQAIIDYCDLSNEVKNWTCEELEDMRKQLNQQIRVLMGRLE